MTYSNKTENWILQWIADISQTSNIALKDINQEFFTWGLIEWKMEFCGPNVPPEPPNKTKQHLSDKIILMKNFRIIIIWIKLKIQAWKDFLNNLSLFYHNVSSLAE